MVLKVFHSYAHQAQQLRRELDAHLSNLKRHGITWSWSNGDIVSNAEWRSESMTLLHTTQLILLLISTDFLASEFCYSIRRLPLRSDAADAVGRDHAASLDPFSAGEDELRSLMLKFKVREEMKR